MHRVARLPRCRRRGNRVSSVAPRVRRWWRAVLGGRGVSLCPICFVVGLFCWLRVLALACAPQKHVNTCMHNITCTHAARAMRLRSARWWSALVPTQRRLGQSHQVPVFSQQCLRFCPTAAVRSVARRNTAHRANSRTFVLHASAWRTCTAFPRARHTARTVMLAGPSTRTAA